MVDKYTVGEVCAEGETMTQKVTPLPIAVRPYPEPKAKRQKKSNQKTLQGNILKRPDVMLVLDTETRIDATQHLTFGSYRLIFRGKCLEEGLFYSDDLPERDLHVLKKYAATHRANTKESRKLKLLTRKEFAAKLFSVGYKTRGLIVGFNLPFDLSRLAVGYSKARGRFGGGFSLQIWSYIKSGIEKAD